MTGRVVAVGLTSLDVVHELSGPLPVGVKTMSESVELIAGGPATNAAVTAAALLGEATLISALGSSDRADIVDVDLSMHGVRVLDCTGITTWSIPVASCIVDHLGERTVVSPGARDSEFVLDEGALQAVEEADVLLLDGHHPTLAEQALAAKRPDCVVVLDAGSVKTRAESWLPQIDVLAASADYSRVVHDGRAADACAHGLSAGCRAVIVTQGADPVLYQLAGWPTPREVPVEQVHVRSTLGAGDAFHGALAAALAQAIAAGEAADLDRLLPPAIRLAAQVATLRVQVLGGRAWLNSLRQWQPRS